ncbi:MAG TPA: pyridoxal phosphate-dependent aminotransferase [Polyangia bacterium]|jgi:Aspartate/tyrosine/aromatic aminotransferase|nr:pyridoxal phosphate-dependent aminotransferase [Polyangia bacterium]
MAVAKSIAEQLERASWIRRMFEEGARLKKERGEDSIFDFTLGNPEVEPPALTLATLRRVVENGRLHSHGYMPNPGFHEVRAAIADKLRREVGLPFAAEHVCMTTGAAAACNVALKAILDPGDEVILLAPFFAEYPFYVGNHGGRVVVVETDAGCLPDVDRIAAAITPRTRGIILNTPNNPSGRVYPATLLRDLGTMLARLPSPPLVISDEPYKCLVYDDCKQAEVASLIAQTAICYSWSKAQALAGERIGFLALSPRLPDWPQMAAACTFANRTLGFVNAPAIWQLVMAEAADACVDTAAYQHKRDVLCEGLAAAGYDVRKPEGGYYVFLKTPIPDDVSFVGLLVKQGVLAVPGTGFGRGGYIRLSMTVPLDTIERALPAFQRALQAARG